MAEIRKIEQIPEEIRACMGTPGRMRSLETQAFADMEVGDMLQINEPEEAVMKRIRKRLESYAKKHRDRKWLVAQRYGTLYVERVK